MPLEKTSEYLPALISLVALVIPYAVHQLSKTKQRLESGKTNIDLVEQLEINLAGGNMRKIEYAFTSLTGASTNGRYIAKIWSSNASNHQMAYLASSCGLYLKIVNGNVRMKKTKMEWVIIRRVLWLLLILVILYLLGFTFLSELQKETYEFSVLAWTLGLYLAFLWISVSILTSIGRISDVAALMGVRSSNKFVDKLMSMNRLPIF